MLNSCSPCPDSGLAGGAACVCVCVVNSRLPLSPTVISVVFSVGRPPHPQPVQTGVKLYSRSASWSERLCAQLCECSLKIQKQRGFIWDGCMVMCLGCADSDGPSSCQTRLQRAFLDRLLPRTTLVNYQYRH